MLFPGPPNVRKSEGFSRKDAETQSDLLIFDLRFGVFA
jgi:hypothetical protein